MADDKKKQHQAGKTEMVKKSKNMYIEHIQKKRANKIEREKEMLNVLTQPKKEINNDGALCVIDK